jgi:hypothetical protein
MYLPPAIRSGVTRTVIFPGGAVASFQSKK